MSYTWQDGEVITAEKLNNTEERIDTIEYTLDANLPFLVKLTKTGNSLTFSPTYNEIYEALQNKIPIIAYEYDGNWDTNMFALSYIDEEGEDYFYGRVFQHTILDSPYNPSLYITAYKLKRDNTYTKTILSTDIERATVQDT